MSADSHLSQLRQVFAALDVHRLGYVTLSGLSRHLANNTTGLPAQLYARAQQIVGHQHVITFEQLCLALGMTVHARPAQVVNYDQYAESRRSAPHLAAAATSYHHHSMGPTGGARTHRQLAALGPTTTQSIR